MTSAEAQDLMMAFNKATVERAMNVHLGYQPGEPEPTNQANERNSASGKIVLIEQKPVRLELPLDRVEIVKTRAFPIGEAAIKLLWLSLRNVLAGRFGERARSGACNLFAPSPTEFAIGSGRHLPT